MNRITIFATSLAATALMLAAPLASQEIVVSPRTGHGFVTDVSKDLQRQVENYRMDTRWEATGIARVRFEAGADGRPINVRTYRRSGSRMLDTAARRMVSGLTSLAPLPEGASKGQVIQANIIVARSSRHLDQLAETLVREEAARMASSEQERAVFAFNLVSNPAS